MNNPRFLTILSLFLLTVGVIALVDGYAEYASGEEGIFRWLMLPLSQFLIGGALFQKARDLKNLNEASDA